MELTDVQMFWHRIDEIVNDKIFKDWKSISDIPQNSEELLNVFEELDQIIAEDDDLISLVKNNRSLFSNIWTEDNYAIDVFLTHLLFKRYYLYLSQEEDLDILLQKMAAEYTGCNLQNRLMKIINTCIGCMTPSGNGNEDEFNNNSDICD
jgi:hypothetical protein